jgi:hypothetical protein
MDPGARDRGQDEQPVSLAGSPASGTAFLAKPFLPHELARKIREVLAPPSTATRSSWRSGPD